MRYIITIYKGMELVRHPIRRNTLADTAELIDILLREYPQPAHQFSVTCEVTRNYTLLDADVTTGAEVTDKLQRFVNSSLGKTA